MSFTIIMMQVPAANETDEWKKKHQKKSKKYRRNQRQRTTLAVIATLTPRRQRRTRRMISMMMIMIILLLRFDGTVAADNHMHSDDNDNNDLAKINPHAPPQSPLSPPQHHHHASDATEDSLFDPVQADPDCQTQRHRSGAENNDEVDDDASCWHPPASTLEPVDEDEDNDENHDEYNSNGDSDKSHNDASSNLTTSSSATSTTCPSNRSTAASDLLSLLKNSSSFSSKTTSSSSYSSKETSSSRKRKKVVGDKHWGSDPTILRLRDQLRRQGLGISTKYASASGASRRRRASTSSSSSSAPPPTMPKPHTPIFLLPGLASTRLVAWRFKSCRQYHPLLSDIKVQEYVWLNLNYIMQMSTMDVSCLRDCLALGQNQSDSDEILHDDDWEEDEDDWKDDDENKTATSTTHPTGGGCKLRPDEGLDAIASLSPGGLHSQLLVGGTNTVYAWLIQWLADHLGYDVTNIVGLPYDWRLSPDKMQARDGFFTVTRRRMEAAVQANGGRPGIVVAHSMGNLILRYFLEWLRTQLRQEAYELSVRRAKRRLQKQQRQQQQQQQQLQQRAMTAGGGSVEEEHAGAAAAGLPGWMTGILAELDEDDEEMMQDTSATSSSSSMSTNSRLDPTKHAQLWELAQMEGDDNWIEWIETHIWTYVGLSAPMLGAVNPVRAVLSGENMGIPVTEEAARVMELSFGSTHTVNPVSSKEGFCDEWSAERWDEEPTKSMTSKSKQMDARLACLDDIFTEIEYSSYDHKRQDPWKDFPALRALLKERRDWDSDFDMIKVVEEHCQPKEKSPCAKNQTAASFGPKDVQTGNIFTRMSELWRERGDPLIVKREQLRESFWDTPVTNILNHTWERPLIKHVIMAYGVDIPTEVGYVYMKTYRNDSKENSWDSGRDNNNNEESYDGIPNLQTVIWETAGGQLEDERMDPPRKSIADLLLPKNKRKVRRQGNLHHSGDGSVPYISLAWAHTWLLHAVRAARYSKIDMDPIGSTTGNPLNDIKISHRPKGAMEWLEGPPPIVPTLREKKKIEESSDTGTAHPHGTKYKPEMIRYHNQGTSRTTGIEYTTTVIEALGVEHKETTRNYDILAAVFTDVLKFMHDDDL